MPDPSSLTGVRLWLRAKDLAGADLSTVTAWADQSGHSQSPTSFSGTTVKTGATPSGGKAARLSSAAINLPSLGLATGGVVPTASTYSYDTAGTYLPANANDGNAGTLWAASTTALPQWLQYRLDTATVVTSYSINTGGAFVGWPADWTLEGSNDGSSWTTLDTRSSETFVTGTARTFTFSNSTAYLYYRLYITAKSGTYECRLSEFNLTGVSTGHLGGEMWIVAKSNTTTGSAWKFGTNAQDNHYTFSGTVYTDFGNATRRTYSPSPTLASSWRLIRCTIDSSGNLSEFVDEGTAQLTATGVGRTWNKQPLLSKSWSGDIAEVLILRTPATSGERADLITYFNTEHGLTVAGGSSGSVTVTAPLVTATTDVLDPTLVSGVAVTAPLGTTTTDVLDPTVSAATSATVTPPLLTTTTDMLDPTVTAASSAVTVTAPLITTTTDLLDPAFIVPAVTVTPITLDFTAGASLTIDSAVSVTPISMDFTAGASLNVVIPRGDNPDPRSNRPQWSFVVTDRAGNRYGQLGKVSADVIEDGVNVTAGMSVTIAATDPKRALIPAGDIARECQVWRGKHLMHKGPILPGAPSDDGSTVTYSVPDARWYFSEDRRVIGRVPKRNLLKNGDFSQGLVYWRGGFDPGTIPALPPLVAVVDSDDSVSGKALQIKGADKSQLTVEDVKTGAVFVPNSSSYLSGGEAIIQAVGANIPAGSTVKIVGHTANNSINGDYGDGMALSLARANAAKATLLAMDGTLSITTEGHGFYEPVATNSTDAGQALNRRVVISYEGTQSATGSAQYESQTLHVSQPASVGKALSLTLVGTRDLTNWIGPNKPGYGVYIQAVKASAPTVIVDSAYSTLNEDSVRDSPQEDVATIEIPANGADYIVEVRYYAPNGVIEWYDLELTPGDLLAFPKTDQALIVKGTVEHMQDTTKGKGALGITTRTPLSGVKRSRWYAEYERQHVDSVLGEFQAINRGLDIDIIPLASGGDVVATYYPRQGGMSDMVLGPGVVMRFSPANTRDVASSIIAQADGSGSYRREAYASDPTALGGLMLERVMSAENETPLRDLDDVARAELAAAKVTTPAYWVECHPKHTNAILDRIAKGDRVRAILRDGVTNVDSTARVVKRRIDPNTDVVSLMIALED